MVLSACTDDAADVKQYGFALVGDLARGCMVHLTPLAEQLVAAQVAALAPNMLTQVRRGVLWCPSASRFQFVRVEPASSLSRQRPRGGRGGAAQLDLMNQPTNQPTNRRRT